MKNFVTVDDLPVINYILTQGDQVTIVPVKGGKRLFRVCREEIDSEKCLQFLSKSGKIKKNEYNSPS